ncbi:MAG: long-chain fatty acid--CoA ligase [Pyrinomonadaceae bacterium]
MSKGNENVRKLLENRALEFSDKPFLFSEADSRSWTYSEFNSAVNRTANLLSSHGIGHGDVVSLLMPNSAEYVIAYFACWKLSAVAGPINSLLKRDEIAWVVENSGSKLLLEGRFTDARDGEPWPVRSIDFDNVDDATKGYSDELREIEITPDAEAIIIYTSGTTGKPKGCLLTHGNLVANAGQIAGWMGFGPDDRLLTVMPLFHMNAVSVTTLTALYAGGSTVVSPRFSASRFWQVIEKYRITSFGSVATMLSMLLSSRQSGVENRHDEKVEESSIEEEVRLAIPESLLPTNDSRPSTLRFAMCGSAPVPPDLLVRFEETFGCLVIEGYGLSESTCRSTFNPPSADRRPGSCGMPIGNEMKIFDEDDIEVANGTLGEIVLRGQNIFKSYFKNEEATEKAFRDGWFHTGDVGYRDDDGFFYIADRKSDMIIRGGENIYPREIDDLLYGHPAVDAAAVIGVPDDLYGEEVAAFVVLKPGSNVTPDELIDYCKQHLADYKCPKTVHFLDEIPKGPTGKLLKRELARRHSGQ